MHKISDTVERKFIDSVDIDEYEIWTDSGWQDISAIHKTVEYERWIIKTERGLYLECADKHIIFNDKMEEIFIENCIPHNTKIATEYGSDLVIECYKTDIIEPMFDITVDSEDHRFYSNGILSHNTTTVAALLLWYILFQDSFSIAILANKERQSREILSRIQLAFEHLPKWLQQGVIQWNKGNIELENGSKILSSSTSSSAIRGGSFNLIYLDEFAFVPNNLQEEFFASVYPTISSGQSSKVLITSTPNGMNMFYKIWTDSEEGRNRYQRVSVHWSDVPGRDDVWKDETISNTSERQFDQEFNCEFLGSSNTLIDGKKLQQLTYRTPLFTSGGVDVYENPEKNKKYITVVDTSRGVDIDYSAFIVFDVTQVPYNIVAKFRANDISPLLYPNIIHQVSTHYNNALALIETNDIGQQVADILHMDLEYDGVIVTQTKGRAGQKIGGGFGSGGGKSKPQFGVRTTRQVKRIGCGNFKTLVENDKLIVNDYDLLYEMARFIENKASYEAEEGHHDDLVMCCIHGSNMIETEDGQKTMRWVVENKYTGKVLSLNAAGEFEWKSVIGHSSKENSGKNKKTWITLGEAASGRKRLICTTDHKCATVSDIFNPEIEYLEADKLDGKYIVKFPNTKKHGFQTLNPSYNKDQVSVILGIQLGDGHINRKGKFSTAHGEKQNEYSRYIQSILGGNLTYNKKNQSRLEFNTTEQTHKLRELMYIDGKKTIKNIYKMIDEISLAFWYMDDGYLKLSKGCINYSVELCTDSFSYEDHLLLKEVLFEKFNINSSIINIKKSPMQYRLRIGTESSKTFFDLIAPYVCKNMEYKIPENYRTIELKPINNSYLDYSIVKANVFYRNQMGLESKLYDIEVEGNHNFVVNNTLVHNCVLFAWLVNQSYFKELTDTDVRSNLVQDNNALLDDDMLPFGMMDFGDDEQAEWKVDPFYDMDFGPHKDYF